MMPFKNFCYSFAHTLPPDEQRAVYERHVVPESRLVGRGPTTAAAAIDFARPRPPLLLIAGELDHIIPASLNQSNFKKYAKSPARTDYKEFAGRTHYILGQAQWGEVADYVDAWIKKTPPA
jgi:alpha-beta hydrolase superfamily lysophospholipase